MIPLVASARQRLSVGIVGVGRMGLPICARLAENGFAVVATDVRREAQAAVLDTGAEWVDGVAEVGERCHVAITVLPGPAAVTAVRDALIAALSPGSTWIDMSTATPGIAGEIAEVARRRRIRTLDAPMAGGPVQAREGRLVAFVGASLEDLDSQREVLAAVAGAIVHVGAVGSGYAVKLLVNLLWFGQAIASAEVLALAVRAGLNPETVRQAAQQSAAASRFMEHDAPWVLRNRAYTPWYLVRYWRFFASRLRNPHVITRGFVFLDRGADIYARRGYGRLILGKWVHLGVNTALRCHEGTLSLGDKSNLGRDISINCYLDVEIGDSALFADDVYISDFDHRFDDLTMPIKDQGIAKSRVRIERDVWLGTKVTVCRGVVIGEGTVVGANAVVTNDLPAFSVAVGVPARVIKDRKALLMCASTTSIAVRAPRGTGSTRRSGSSRPTRTARPTPTCVRVPAARPCRTSTCT